MNQNRSGRQSPPKLQKYLSDTPMYLARKQVNQTIHYVIRQSVSEDGMLVSRDLFDLGSDPEDYLVYPDNGHAFYFDENLCHALEARGVAPDYTELEALFWPFLAPETRRIIEKFSRAPAGRRGSLAEQKKRCEIETFHVFDRRRMHFLRFGEMDQTRLAAVPQKIYRKLLDKSRDEIEQQFIEMEQVLSPREKKNYTFVIFNVAGHFESALARRFPQALPEDKVDECFLEEVCRVNDDAAFWADLLSGGRLHPYLVRYVCWFFDHDFFGGQYLDDLVWQFKRRHHQCTPPQPRQHMEVDEALAVLEIDRSELAKLTVKILTRQYRRMAKRHHPDQGGRHEAFIRLNRAFEDLLRRVKAGGGKTTRYHTRRG
ncbi:MAG: J domain-containing protein [Desulfosudaceae bacterium]